MKTTLIFVSLFLGFAAQAADVTVTSFHFLQNQTTAAEICGFVTAPTGQPTFLKVTVDIGTKVEAPYYIWAGSDGKFCSIVSTYAGKAIVELSK